MKLHSLLPLALLTLAASASADGFYIAGEVTHSKASLDKNHFDNALTAGGATGISSSDKGDGNQWRLQGGYRFNQNVAVEAGYIDFGKAKYKADFNGGSAQGSLKAGGVDVAGVFTLPLNDSFSVFGKAGIVAAKVKSKLAATGMADSNTSASVVRPLVGVGATYKLSQNVDLRADFDHVSGLGKTDKTGKMNDNMVSLGVVYNF